MAIKMRNADEEKILAYIEEHQYDMYNMLSELVKIDTVNHRSYGNENDGQDYLEKLCRELELEIDRFAPESLPGFADHKDYNPGRAADKRDNLVATLKGADTSRTVMLAAHMDTETLGELSKWTDDPLSGIIRDGKIYGRGAGDDKSGIAIAWYVMKAFKECGIVPKRNIKLASYSDEEGGGGNGALALALRHPCDFCINLDSIGYENEAQGGGCFSIVIRSVRRDRSIASVFDVFEGVRLVVTELEKLNTLPGTSIRLSNAHAGVGGTKEGKINIAIYTNMTKEESQAKFDDICLRLKGEFDRLGLETDGFVLTTRFFIYGKTPDDSPEAKLMEEIITEDRGYLPDKAGTCLSDLSLLMAYGCKNSFNYGIRRGSDEGGGSHLPNEHACFDELKMLATHIAILLLRM